MPKTIYEKPTRVLLKDLLTEWQLKPGQVITTSQVVDWFNQRYPLITARTVRAHLVQAATNDPSRLHHPATNETDDLLFKVGAGLFRLYEPGRDPAPIHDRVPGGAQQQEEEAEDLAAQDDDAEEEGGGPAAGSTEFLLERDLQRYLAENLDCIEPGLQLYVEEGGARGLEFDAGGRRIDILAVDRAGALVVLELKVSKGYDRVVGQLLRYQSWVRLHMAKPGQRVRGMIVCRTMAEDLRLACSGLPDVELFEYKLSVTVQKVPALDEAASR